MKIKLVNGITEAAFSKLETAAVAAFKATKQSTTDFGKAIIALRDACAERGQFTKWLKSNGIDHQHAMYAMRVADGTQKKRKKSNGGNQPEIVAALSSSLYKLYELDAAGETEEANELARQIIREIEATFITEEEDADVA